MKNVGVNIDVAEELAQSPRFLEAFRSATRSPDLWQLACDEPVAFLTSRDIKVPSGLQVKFRDKPSVGKPDGDYEPFVFRQFNCRVYRHRQNKPPFFVEEVTICFGFEITPHYLPPTA